MHPPNAKPCAVLCCAVLCCAVLVLCCAVLCCAVLCCAVLCCAVLCCAVLCCAVLPVRAVRRRRAQPCGGPAAPEPVSHVACGRGEPAGVLEHAQPPPAPAQDPTRALQGGCAGVAARHAAAFPRRWSRGGAPRVPAVCEPHSVRCGTHQQHPRLCMCVCLCLPCVRCACARACVRACAGAGRARARRRLLPQPRGLERAELAGGGPRQLRLPLERTHQQGARAPRATHGAQRPRAPGVACPLLVCVCSLPVHRQQRG
jgi:hypothetical protein